MSSPVATPAEAPCPLATALDAIGSKWSLRILYELARGPRHFNELQRLNSGISHKVLTETLRHLEGDRLIEREAIPGAVPRVRYALTTEGETVRPVLGAMIAWGNARLSARAAMPQPATDAREDHPQPAASVPDRLSPVAGRPEISRR